MKNPNEESIEYIKKKYPLSGEHLSSVQESLDFYQDASDYGFQGQKYEDSPKPPTPQKRTKEHKQAVKGYKQEIRKNKGNVAQIVDKAGHENRTSSGGYDTSEGSIMSDVMGSRVAKRAYKKIEKKSDKARIKKLKSEKKEFVKELGKKTYKETLKSYRK